MWDVLKWILLVLAAGFIGQFGRTFAQRLIERKRRERAAEASRPPTASEPSTVTVDPNLERDRLEAEAKVEKKRLKSEAKLLKKAAKAEEKADD